MVYHHQSYSFSCLRYCLLVLCISMIIIQVSQALNDDLSSSSIEENNSHELYRRDSKKVAHMFQQMLQRGEMQVEPGHFRKFLGRLHRRKTTNQMKNYF